MGPGLERGNIRVSKARYRGWRGQHTSIKGMGRAGEGSMRASKAWYRGWRGQQKHGTGAGEGQHKGIKSMTPGLERATYGHQRHGTGVGEGNIRASKFYMSIYNVGIFLNRFMNK
jgi:hypothetical protein